MSMREEFEVWARDRGMNLEYRNVPGIGQFYVCPRTFLAQEAWEASRAALVVELPAYGEAILLGGVEMRSHAIKALREQGIQVKP